MTNTTRRVGVVSGQREFLNTLLLVEYYSSTRVVRVVCILCIDSTPMHMCILSIIILL